MAFLSRKASTFFIWHWKISVITVGVSKNNRKFLKTLPLESQWAAPASTNRIPGDDAVWLPKVTAEKATQRTCGFLARSPSSHSLSGFSFQNILSWDPAAKLQAAATWRGLVEAPLPRTPGKDPRWTQLSSHPSPDSRLVSEADLRGFHMHHEQRRTKTKKL